MLKFIGKINNFQMMKQEWSDNMKNVQIMNEKELEKKQVLVSQLER